MTARRLRVGAVRYLNTKPLIADLEAHAPQIDLSLDLPSRLATDLVAGRLDVALIPVVEWLAHTELELVGDACIATQGPVWSVKLLFRGEPWDVRMLALDEGSRTSACLARVLLNERFGLRPETTVWPIGVPAEAVACDAAVMIGDRAMHAPPPAFPIAWDLGEEWTRETGRPFVFAVWAVRPGVDLGGLESALSIARDAGLARLPEIAATAGPAVGVTPAAAESYFRDNLCFTLGPAERAGLALFARRAAALGLIDSARPIPRHRPTTTS